MPLIPALVIYHRNCIDGFAGATVAFMAGIIKTKSQLYPDVPSSTTVLVDKIKGREVYIIDVAYPLPVVKEICKSAKKVTFIDHHLTTEAFATNHGIPNLIVVYNKSVCGGVNAWKHFFRDAPMPKALEYINDNDTGTWTLPDTKAFTAGVELKMSFQANTTTLEQWKALFTSATKVTEIISEGQQYEKYRAIIAQANRSRIELVNFPGPSAKLKEKFKKQYKVALINASCPTVTTLGNAILEMEKPAFDLVAMWWYSFKNNTYSISFRSKTVDVHEIAKLFGGGGHKLAAACIVPATEYTIRDIFGA